MEQGFEHDDGGHISARDGDVIGGFERPGDVPGAPWGAGALPQSQTNSVLPPPAKHDPLSGSIPSP